jgi:hypothetical protein
MKQFFIVELELDPKQVLDPEAICRDIHGALWDLWPERTQEAIKVSHPYKKAQGKIVDMAQRFPEDPEP